MLSGLCLYGLSEGLDGARPLGQLSTDHAANGKRSLFNSWTQKQPLMRQQSARHGGSTRGKDFAGTLNNLQRAVLEYRQRICVTKFDYSLLWCSFVQPARESAQQKIRIARRYTDDEPEPR